MIMKLTKHLINYTYENSLQEHHILVTEHHNQLVILSAINLYIKTNCSNSLNTSERYSSAIKRFLEYLITQFEPDSLDHNFWRLAQTKHIRMWQGEIVSKRDEKNDQKPKDENIRNTAQLVYKFYCWANEVGFPTIINSNQNDWEFNYKASSKLFNKVSMFSGSNPDSGNIDIGKRNKGVGSNKVTSKKIIIMPDENISSLMSAYSDPVYPALLNLALATGMRESGCVQMPYIGTGENSHIRSYPDICNEIDDGKNAKTFSFTLREKSAKRTLQVNMAAWQVICESYLPIYFERKKLFEKKNPGKSCDQIFFLKKNGEPVRAKDVADQTYIAKKKLINFPWTFHSARDWYATKFLIKNLSKNQINNLYYDTAVEEELRKQIGHKDIKTTYMHYVRQASLILAIADGSFDITLGHDKDFFESLIKKGSKVSENSQPL